jgi:hypothetical protein
VTRPTQPFSPAAAQRQLADTTDPIRYAQQAAHDHARHAAQPPAPELPRSPRLAQAGALDTARVSEQGFSPPRSRPGGPGNSQPLPPPAPGFSRPLPRPVEPGFSPPGVSRPAPRPAVASFTPPGPGGERPSLRPAALPPRRLGAPAAPRPDVAREFDDRPFDGPQPTPFRRSAVPAAALSWPEAHAEPDAALPFPPPAAQPWPDEDDGPHAESRNWPVEPPNGSAPVRPDAPDLALWPAGAGGPLEEQTWSESDAGPVEEPLTRPGGPPTPAQPWPGAAEDRPAARGMPVDRPAGFNALPAEEVSAPRAVGQVAPDSRGAEPDQPLRPAAHPLPVDGSPWPDPETEPWPAEPAPPVGHGAEPDRAAAESPAPVGEWTLSPRPVVADAPAAYFQPPTPQQQSPPLPPRPAPRHASFAPPAASPPPAAVRNQVAGPPPAMAPRPQPAPMNPPRPQPGYPTPSGGYPVSDSGGYPHDDQPRSGYPVSAEPAPEKPSSRWGSADRPARGSNKREDNAFKKATYLVKLEAESVFDAEGTAIPPVIGG